MPPLPLPRRHLVAFVGLLALVLLAGCNRRSMLEVNGPPDLAKDGQTDPHGLALRIRVFHVQHIWAGAGYEADGADYRAKVAVWAYAQGEPALAELYFHDVDRFDPAGRHKNTAPGAGPNQIHFPVSTLGPLLGLMRSTNEPMYLFYFRGKWSIGTSRAEAIGSE